MIRRTFRLAVSLPRRLFRVGLFTSALAAGGLLAAGCFGERIDGSGVSATQDRDVGPVTEVFLSGTGSLKVVAGDTPSLTVTADDNVLPLIETPTAGRELHLTTHPDYSIRAKTPIVYTLTVPRLHKLVVSGSGSALVVDVPGDDVSIRVSGSGEAGWRLPSCRSLKIDVTGSGHVTAGGSAEKVEIKVSGSGDVYTAKLEARDVRAEVSGSGTVSLWAIDQLNARVSGSGVIKYKGSPKLDRKVSGSGRIEPFGE